MNDVLGTGGKYGKGVPADREGEVPNEFVQGLTLEEVCRSRPWFLYEM